MPCARMTGRRRHAGKKKERYGNEAAGFLLLFPAAS